MSRLRPWAYMDCIDSVLNVRPDLDLVVADARSTDSIRAELLKHQQAGGAHDLALYPERASQWAVLNQVLRTHGTDRTKYFVYTSSDIIWTHDWVGEAIKEFERDPALMIVFPCVNSGDPAMPLQVASGPRDEDLIDPADHMDCEGARAARAPCLNAYAFVMRMEFLKAYGGYMTLWRNCFTESFLHYQCEAIGGKMRLMPRGWCFHHNGIDGWVGEGGFYNYTAEKPLFDRVMDTVLAARSEGKMTKEFLRSILYV